MIKKIFPKSETLKNIFTLISATVMAQGVSILVSPILSRLYTPKDFGIMATYGAVVGLTTILSTGRYELAIMLPEKEEDSVNIIALSISISIILSLISLVLLFFLNTELVYLVNVKELMYWFYVIPLSIFLTGVYQSFNFWLNRNKRYNELATIRVTQSIIATAANLSFGLWGMGANGLIAAALIGQVIGTVFIGIRVLYKDVARIKEISILKIKENARMYKDFPRINLLHSFVDILQSSSVVFFMGIMFNPSVLGSYSFSRRVMKAPVDILISSISEIFYQKISETYTKGADLYFLLKGIIKKLTVISLPIFLVLTLFGSQLFSFVFGPNWASAGLYAQILSPWIWLNFIASPISHTAIVMQKQKGGFYMGLFYNLAICIPLFMVGYLTGDIIKSLFAMSFAASAVLIIYMLWLLKISKNTKVNLNNG
jgi:O-antigen/teichoic acid export membrane protein